MTILPSEDLVSQSSVIWRICGPNGGLEGISRRNRPVSFPVSPVCGMQPHECDSDDLEEAIECV
jgi:hypothetical protein